MIRDEIKKETIDELLINLKDHLNKKMKQKGMASFGSRKEVMGTIYEEVYEAQVESHNRNDKDLQIELLDIAVAALWGVASMRTIYK